MGLALSLHIPTQSHKIHPSSPFSFKKPSYLFSMKTLAGTLTGIALSRFARIIAAPHVRLESPLPTTPTVYYANHSSNGDTVLLWSTFSPKQRSNIRPVAAADYWETSKLRRFIGRDVFNILPVERNKEQRTSDPIADMQTALDDGYSLIIFPEGGRNDGTNLMPFKTGIYHLAASRPQTPFMPVWIDNLNGVMPKGEIIPVPLVCSLHFGTPFTLEAETKQDFLEKAHQRLLAQRPTT